MFFFKHGVYTDSALTVFARRRPNLRKSLQILSQTLTAKTRSSATAKSTVRPHTLPGTLHIGTSPQIAPRNPHFIRALFSQ